MNALLLKPGTVVPNDEDVKLAAESSRALAANAADRALRLRIGDGPEITLPKGAAKLLSNLLAEMAQGNAVAIFPIHAELTTQEAADFLNVSRPYLVNLVEQGQIPCRMVGTHRRIRFQYLLAYKEKADQAHDRAKDELVAQAQKLGMGY